MDFRLLKRLADAPGVSGREDRVREVVSAELAGLTDRISLDPLGNLVARLAGPGPEKRPKVALVAHLDEVGFLVSKIEPEGFLRVAPMGGVDPRVFGAQTVVVHGREELKGVVGSVPPHLSSPAAKEGGGPVPIEECAVDLGLPPNRVAELVRIGDPVTFAVEAWENETCVMAKALDDRAGLFVMIEAARRAFKAGLGCDLALIGSVQEEFGLRGAGPATFKFGAEVVLVLEGTFALDTPGVKLPANLVPTRLGGGPEIRISDQQAISDPKLVDLLCRLAREGSLPHQLIVKRFGATDAAPAQIAGPGTKACTLSVPVRYIHAPVGVAAKADLESAVELTAAFLQRAGELLNDS